jgi:probable phosphoglycerate mutase
MSGQHCVASAILDGLLTDLDLVFIARHGQTAWNLDGRRMGRLDSPLTTEGWQQTKQIATVACAQRVDGVFASPLGRALSTAEHVATSLACEIVLVDALAEIDHGTFAGLTTSQITERFPNEWAARMSHKYDWRFPGGESYCDARGRADTALREVLEHGMRRPLLVTHEMICRVLLMALLDLTPDQALLQSLPHGTVLAVRPSAREVRSLPI